jgi:hypothetical protein
MAAVNHAIETGLWTVNPAVDKPLKTQQTIHQATSLVVKSIDQDLSVL